MRIVAAISYVLEVSDIMFVERRSCYGRKEIESKVKGFDIYY